MIPASDLWMLGLRPAPVRGGHMAPTAAARPLEPAELFPDRAVRRRQRLTVGLTCSLHWGAARRLLTAFHEAHPDVELVVENLQESGPRDDSDIDTFPDPPHNQTLTAGRTAFALVRILAALAVGAAIAAGFSVALGVLHPHRGQVHHTAAVVAALN
jgi:hypothetical protein